MFPWPQRPSESFVRLLVQVTFKWRLKEDCSNAGHLVGISESCFDLEMILNGALLCRLAALFEGGSCHCWQLKPMGTFHRLHQVI